MQRAGVDKPCMWIVQVQYSYSYSSKAENPAHLILTSCTGMMKERMEQTCDGYDRWPITVHEKPYTEVTPFLYTRICSREVQWLTGHVRLLTAALKGCFVNPDSDGMLPHSVYASV